MLNAEIFNKKKLHFWRLTFIFAAITIVTLFVLWSTPHAPKAQMMDSSMGNMMKSMHVNGSSIYSLFNSGDSQMPMGDMHSHHNGQSAVIFKMSFLTTSIIFLLLPLVIGGSIILAIVWIR